MVPLAGHGNHVDHRCRRAAAVNGGKRLCELLQAGGGFSVLPLPSQALDFGIECGGEPCAPLVVAGWRNAAFARSPHQVVAERPVEGTLRLWHEVARHRGRGVGEVFRLGKQVNEHLLGAGRVEVHDGGDVPAGVAHAAAIAERSMVAGRARGPAAAHPLDVGADERHEVRHVFGFSDLCNRRGQVGLLLAVEVVLAEHEIDAAFQVGAEACLQVVVGDAQRFHVRPGDPAEKVRRDFDVERVAAGDGREDAGRGDVVGKAAEHGFELVHHLPLEFVPHAGFRIHLAPQLAQLRKYARRKIGVRACGDDGNHAAEVLVLEVFGLEALQVFLDEALGNGGRERQPVSCP